MDGHFLCAECARSWFGDRLAHCMVCHAHACPVSAARDVTPEARAALLVQTHPITDDSEYLQSVIDAQTNVREDLPIVLAIQAKATAI